MKKLHKSQIISKLVAATPLTTISLLMRNFIAEFRQNPRNLQGFRRKSCE